MREDVRTLARSLSSRAAIELRDALRPRGAVIEVGDGVAHVVGLDAAGSEELIEFDSGALGMAYDLARDRTGVLLLSGAERVRAGEGARAQGRGPTIPTGDALLGRAIDPLGRAIDGRSTPEGEPRAVLCRAPELTQRAPVQRPLHTGVMVIDSAIPIGRGQRQLIVGDHDTGKTALALDVITAQRAGDVACVYVAIGQPLTRVLGLHASLARRGCSSNTVLISADASRTPGLQYLAPYAGTTIAEELRSRGRDVLVVYDDLTKHADAYRELALLLGRPPGREAFPGDIFYIHAELLERACALDAASGGGSITALPIVETTDGDISSYIPTNLISITDGQIYLDAARFERNERPAVDVGRSVSRIGAAAQPPALRDAARQLRITLARFQSLEALTRIGLDVDPSTRELIARGRLMHELLQQPRFAPRSVAAQVAALTAALGDWLAGRDVAEAAQLLWSQVDELPRSLPDFVEALERGEAAPKDWSERWHAQLVRALESTK